MRVLIAVLFLMLGLSAAAQETPAPPDDGAPAAAAPASAEDAKPAAEQARDLGLKWLLAHQNENGSYGKDFTVTVTSLAALAFLASSDDPFTGGPGARALEKALGSLLALQKEGLFPKQGHTWIHGQGFAALALTEALSRASRSETKPDLDLKALRAAAVKAVRHIEANQSASGGWWYVRGDKRQHEGSTTVTAVQALVSAARAGIETDAKVLERGFEYLKKCQNEDGGFDYKLGPGEASMKEGTAADVATLALMEKFDFTVMMKGYRYLLKAGPGQISSGRFPYYGHFYGVMGMRLLREEIPPFAKEIDPYVGSAIRDIASWQREDGSWPLKGWMASYRKEGDAYSTAFATLLLSVPEGRLTIFSRK